MNRAVIIIGNQGSSRNYLPGVSVDVANYQRFFLSNAGGAWEEHEIWISTDWTKRSLEQRIEWLKNIGTEYFLIVFSGHGYALKNGDIYLELGRNEDLALKLLQRWLLFKKSLVITDSCRAVVEIIEKANAEARLRLFDSTMSVSRAKYRALYDSKLNELEICHNTVITSANHDECADDTDHGGLYSSTLLSYAEDIIQRGKIGTHSIGQLHNQISSIVTNKSGGRQNPQIYSSERELTPPFVVIPSRWY